MKKIYFQSVFVFLAVCLLPVFGADENTHLGGSASEEHGTGAPESPALNPLLEHLEGPSEETLIQGLTNKSAILQAASGTEPAGVCFEGTLKLEAAGPDEFLKKGPFGKAEVSNVQIRVGDINRRLQTNPKREGKGISISFEVNGKKFDLSMTRDPVLAFGNLTDFNNFLSLQILIGGLNDQLKSGQISQLKYDLAVAKFMFENPDVAESMAKVSSRGLRQADHSENYFTGLAYTFGDDQAAKFKLIRCPGKEPKDFCYDLQVEILDADIAKKLKGPDGKTHPLWEWVEDTSLNWTEALRKAKYPSYTLGRLTANKGSLKSTAECDDLKNNYNVKEHSAADVRPAGRMARALAREEDQSRKLGNPKFLAANEPGSSYSHTEVADQGLSDGERQKLWYGSQGSTLIPVDWFMALKDPKSSRPFSETLEGLGFINMGEKTALNPDGLPIGFARTDPTKGGGVHFSELQGKGDWLGLTCSACHTGETVSNGVRTVIDGAPAHVDLEKFLVNMEKALKPMTEDKKAFQEFKSAVEKRSDGKITVSQDDVKKFYAQLYQRNSDSFFIGGDRSKPVNLGPGYTDALGQILNRAGGHKNARAADARVKFPQLNVWSEDEQYGGFSHNPGTRNVGEAIGVFASIQLDPDKPHFLETTADIPGQVAIENLYRKMRPASYEKIFHKTFNASEKAAMERGRVIFDNNCEGCHNARQPIPELGNFRKTKIIPATEFNLELKRNKDNVGTDPKYLQNLSKWQVVDMGNFQGKTVLGALLAQKPRLLEQLRFSDDVRDDGGNPIRRGPVGKKFIEDIQNKRKFKAKDSAVELLEQTTVALTIKYLAENEIEVGPNSRYLELTGGADFAAEKSGPALKAPDLRGVGTRGYLFHNGSVFSLEELLTVPDKRTTDYTVGGFGFDPSRGVYQSSGSYPFRANQLGSLNIGHPYGTELRDDQKADLIQFLKVLGDPRYANPE